MRTLLIIQARMSSCRFPHKMVAELAGMPMFEFVYRRCLKSKADIVVLATSEDTSDDQLADMAKSKGFEVFRGSLDDVLGRFTSCAKKYGADEIIRLCGDSPLVDIALMEKTSLFKTSNGLDFVAPERGTFIPAFDSEVFSMSALEKADKLADTPQEREHVTLFIRNHPELFRCGYFDANLICKGYEDRHLTVDYKEDMILNQAILDSLPAEALKDFTFTSEMVLNYLIKRQNGI